MKKTIGLLSCILALGLSTQVQAESYNFLGSDNGGTGSATMDISISGNILTAYIDNTSPTLLDGGSGDNAPGITGFGFDLLNNPLPGLNSWSLTALDSTNTLVTIDDQSGTGDWVMNTFVAGVSLDFLPTAGSPAQIKGALYNPAASGSTALAALPNYFTQATLTMEFSDSPILDTDSLFVRMQNVGNGGSLKLYGQPGEPCDEPGTPGCGGTTATPEPGTMFLMGSGLAGLGVWRWKKNAKSQA